MIVKSKGEILRLLEENRERLINLGVRRLGLFGSAVRGEATYHSDLDFIIDLKQKTFDSYMDVKEFLEDLFQCQVDLVLIDGIKPRLRETIISETVYAPGF
jgi:uncharacterized protein